MSLQFSHYLQTYNIPQARDIYTTSRLDIKMYIDPCNDITIREQLDKIIDSTAATASLDNFKWLIDTLDIIEMIDTNTNEEYIDFIFDHARYFKIAIESGNIEVAQYIYRECDYIRIEYDDIMIDYIKNGQLMAFKAMMYVSRRGINPGLLRENGIPEHVIDWYNRTMSGFNHINPYNRSYLLF